MSYRRAGPGPWDPGRRLLLRPPSPGRSRMSTETSRPGPPAAVITGAGTGIGAAVARRLAAGGTPVVLTGRRPQPLRDVAADLGDAALVVPGDAGSAADMTRVAEAAVARFGGVGVLVANAGGAGA